MRGPYLRRGFLSNEDAISEEFTSLPALSIVMIGFTLFIVLLANTYGAYHDRMDRLEEYQTAGLIVQKMIDTSCPFIQSAKVVHLQRFLASELVINEVREEYQQSGFDFFVRVSFNTSSYDVPATDMSDISGNRIAVSQHVSVVYNDVGQTPGKLTVILWKV